MSALLFALGGGLGAVARDAAGRVVPGHAVWATLAVNVLGSLALGLVVATLHPSPLLLGFCGGFTTFSTFAVQTLALGPLRGSLNAAANLALSWSAFAAGLLA